jgi:hypothetical protein
MSTNANSSSEQKERMENTLITCNTFLDTGMKDQTDLQDQTLSKVLQEYSELPLDSKKQLLVALCCGGLHQTSTSFSIEPIQDNENQHHKGENIGDIEWGKSDYPQVLLEMVVASRLICDYKLFFAHLPNGQQALAKDKGELLPSAYPFAEDINTNPYEQHIHGNFTSLQLLAPKDSVLQLLYQCTGDDKKQQEATEIMRITHHHFVCRTVTMVFLAIWCDPRESAITLLSPAFVSFLVGYSSRRSKPRWNKISKCELTNKIKWKNFLTYLEKPTRFSLPKISVIVDRLMVAEIQGRQSRIKCILDKRRPTKKHQSRRNGHSFIVGDAALWIAQKILKKDNVSGLLEIQKENKKVVKGKKKKGRQRGMIKREVQVLLNWINLLLSPEYQKTYMIMSLVQILWIEMMIYHHMIYVQLINYIMSSPTDWQVFTCSQKN